MRKALIISGVVSLLAFMTYASFHAWIAFVQPKRPVHDFVFAPECEKIEMRSNAHKGSPLECQARLDEAKRLQDHPGLAVRDGDNLTIFYRGQIISKLIPQPQSDTDDGCQTYAVHKVLKVYDDGSGHLENLAQISCHAGEFERRFVVMPDGRSWKVSDASASPDGRLLATGQNGFGRADQDKQLTFYAWPSRQVVARFPVECRVIEWSSSSRVRVTCLHDFDPESERGDPVAFDADVWRNDAGVWRMQATRWLKIDFEYNKQGDLEFPPTFSLRWLPRFTAIMP